MAASGIRSCFFLLLFAAYSSSASQGSDSALVSRIAFGSCSNQSTPQPIWDAIVDFDPQVFVWLGDNIYGDNKHPFISIMAGASLLLVYTIVSVSKILIIKHKKD